MRWKLTSLHALALCAATTFVAATAGLAPQLFAQSPAGQSPMQQSPNAANPAQPNGMQNGQMGQMAPPDGGTQMQDKMFLQKASEGGMAEVQLGKLAAEKGNSSEVKQFGQKMVEDHTRLNEQLKPIADTFGVSAPKHLNKADQAEYDKLSGLSGDAFDQEYITDMVKDHRKDLHEFRREETATSNPELKQAVGQAEQVISQHLSMIQGIAQQKGIQVPGGPHGKGDNGAAPAQ
jgi:putative membrane protein